jgi:uncharacterized protein (TIGR02391 family)
MADLYERFLPPAEHAVELPPEELALFILRLLCDPATKSSSLSNRYNFTLLSETKYVGTLPKRDVRMALAEAWAWLEREGLVVPSPDDSRGNAVEVSRRGRTLVKEVDFEAYKQGTLLRRDSLDPLLVQDVWPRFVRGDYDGAVFQAFKLVEVRVRALGQFNVSDTGMALMREAFHPERGALTDSASDKGERDGLQALFAGAMGTFKNPGSHRIVPWDSAEAAEAVYFANTLLRVLGRIEVRLASSAGHS